jgi:hypothetical protein
MPFMSFVTGHLQEFINVDGEGGRGQIWLPKPSSTAACAVSPKLFLSESRPEIALSARGE